MRRIRHLLVAMTLLLLGFGVSAPAASAHDVLRSTNPKDGATIARMPSEIVLTFDQPALKVGSVVAVTGPTGNVATGSPTLIDKQVKQAVSPQAPAGRYTVTWRVTSSDGHPISGTFAFTTTAATPSETATASATATASPSATASPTPTAAASPTDSAARAAVPAAQPETSRSWAWAVVAAVALAAFAAYGISRRRRRA